MHKAIGVLGGMGPDASASFYQQLVHICQQTYGAVQDGDYPTIHVHSLSVQGSSASGVEDDTAIVKEMIEACQLLELCKCDFIVIPCNTIHVHYAQLQESVNIPIVHIIECAAQEVACQGISQVGVLGSETTLQARIYQTHLENLDVIGIEPELSDFQQITNLIHGVMGGSWSNTDKQGVLEVCDKLVEKKSQAIILGCTELPLAISQADFDIPVIDTLNHLAHVALAIAYQAVELKTTANGVTYAVLPGRDSSPLPGIQEGFTLEKHHGSIRNISI